MGKLRQRVRAGGIGLVVAYDGDRLSRKLLHKLLLQEELTEQGIGLDYVTGTPDLNSVDGIANEQQKGVEAQREAGRIRARTMKGRHQAALEAEQHGHAKFLGGPVAYGYAVTGGNLVPGPEAETLKKMFTMVVGASCHAVAQRLNALGVRPPRGKRWFRSTVQRILVNPIYSGAFTFHPQGAEPVSITVPALVSKETFLKAQEALKANAVRFSGKPTQDTRLLKGLLRCPCGQRMHGEQSHGKAYYRCSSGKQGQHCGAPYYSAPSLEEAVRAKIEALLRNPQTLREAIEANATTDERDEARSELSQVKAELQKARRHRETLYSDRLDGTVDKAMFTRTDGPLKAKEETLTAELQRLEARMTQLDADRSTVDAALKQTALLARGIDRLDRQGWQRVFNLVIDHVMVETSQLVIHGRLETDSNPQALARAA